VRETAGWYKNQKQQNQRQCGEGAEQCCPHLKERSVPGGGEAFKHGQWHGGRHLSGRQQRHPEVLHMARQQNRDRPHAPGNNCCPARCCVRAVWGVVGGGGR